jgi:hypothetical protein
MNEIFQIRVQIFSKQNVHVILVYLSRNYRCLKIYVQEFSSNLHRLDWLVLVFDSKNLLH